MEQARVYFDQHPVYLVGPLNAHEIGDRVEIPKGRNSWYSRPRPEAQEAEIMARHPMGDGVYQAVVICENCEQYHLGGCEK